MRITKWAFAIGAALAAGPALAEVDLAEVDSCIAETPDRPAACILPQMADCAQIPPERNTIAILCFETARKVWNDGIAARVAGFAEIAPEQIATIAGIETKYAVLSQLLQCDRVEELQRLTSVEPLMIQRRKTMCEAEASGRAYTGLVWQIENMEAPE